MAKKRTVEKCKICEEKLGKTELNIIYRMLVATDKSLYHVGLQKLIGEVGEYAMRKGYHLSASQIILLRPDVMREFLNKKYNPQKVVFFVLQEYECCDECLEDYKKQVPLR